MLDLAFDQSFHFLAHVDGRNEQLAVVILRRITGQVIEQIGCVGADILIAGEHADIFVQLSGDGIIVSSSQVNIAFYVFAFLTHDQGDFGMSLQTQKTVNYVHALLFQHPSPTDVALFIETSF